MNLNAILCTGFFCVTVLLFVWVGGTAILPTIQHHYNNSKSETTTLQMENGDNERFELAMAFEWIHQIYLRIASSSIGTMYYVFAIPLNGVMKTIDTLLHSKLLT